MSTIQMILVVGPLVFFASLVDAVAGGGGLISLPAYLVSGMPIHMASGSNKFSAGIGTLSSTYRFLKNGTINMKIALLSAVFSFIGSNIGAQIALLLSDRLLSVIMTILLPFIAIFLLINKNKSGDISTLDNYSKSYVIVLSIVIGFTVGMYDGFFGPGTGTFIILGYTTFIGLDFTTACANAKVVNLASNISALFVFISAGKVMYSVAIPAALFSIAGHWVGSGLVIKNGSKFIRPVMLCVLAGLFAKIIYDMAF